VPAGITGRSIRVALAAGIATAHLSATGEWKLLSSGGAATLVRGKGQGVWRIERRGDQLRVINAAGTMAATRDGPFVARPSEPGAFVTWEGKRYRGELVILPSHDTTGLLVLDRLGVEDYLRGVVPSELGDVTELEVAALEAQAVAARSYAYVRLDDPDAAARPYDLLASVTDQLYGGVDAETRWGDAAILATTGQVLRYAGLVVSAPYHSSCGGSTAAPTEVWHTTDAPPYLRGVSDKIPGTDHYYCEGSAHFRWTQTYTGSQLRATLERYLPQYTLLHGMTVGRVRGVLADPPTASGRASGVTIVTDRGRYDVRGNDVRFVFRTPDGAVLHSTYFFLESTLGATGEVASLTLHGAGNGHGVGMCQWGAIGRARAGQDYRMILATYYPGTTVAPID
jgi:stage II sporulation protein D